VANSKIRAAEWARLFKTQCRYKKNGANSEIVGEKILI